MKGHTVEHQHHDESVVTALFHQMSRWHSLYVQRRELASMSDNALKDLGLSRADILEEVERPFWDDPLKK